MFFSAASFSKIGLGAYFLSQIKTSPCATGLPDLNISSVRLIVAYDYDKVEIEVCGNFKFNVQIEKTEVFYENLDEIKTKVNNLLRNELEALAGKYGKLKDEPFAECNVK